VNSRSRFLLPLMLVSSGCTAGPPLFQATWYLVDYDVDYDSSDVDYESSPKGLFLAVVNRSKEPQEIKSLLVNPFGDSGKNGWKWEGSQKLARGQVLVVNQESLINTEDAAIKWGPCWIPIEMTITTSQIESLKLQITGSVPSALPVEWFNCPDAPASEPPQDS